MTDRDPDVQRALARAAETVSFQPDVDDVGQGLEGGRRRRRASAAAVGGIAAVAVAISLWAVFPLATGNEDSRAGQEPLVTEEHEEAADYVPEGKLLIQWRAGPEVLDSESDDERALGEDLFGLDMSAEGGQILAATPQEETSGVERDTELVVVDVASGERRVIVQAEPTEALGLAAWSPDGGKVGYLTADAVPNLTDTAPQQTLCVSVLTESGSTCYPNLGSVFSFDWSSDGQRLLVAGPGTEPVQALDVITGEASVVIPSGGNDSIRSGLSAAGLGAVQTFRNPTWSPSGAYVAATAVTIPGGDVAIIVTAQGDFVALGKPGVPDLHRVAWSPGADILAYTVGVSEETTETQRPSQIWNAYLIDPTEGERLIVHGRESFVTGLTWSPSGEWLAFDEVANDGITISIYFQEKDGEEQPRLIILGAGGVPDPTKDWSI